MLDFRFILTRFQKKALEKALSVARNLGQYTATNRIRAILAIAEGKSIGEIASILRVSPATIRQWLTKYLTGGLKALRTVHKQSGRLSRLTKTQKRQLKQWITDGPQGVGFPGACWRSPMIQELICQKFGVFYSVKYISQLLKNLGFSYQNFPTFDSLKQKVEGALLRHSNRQKAICNLFGFYHEIKVA